MSRLAPDAVMPAAETDVILGDLGVLLLECGTSVTDVRGSLEQVSRRAAPETTLEFAILPEMVMVSRPGAASATTTVIGKGEALTFRQSARASRLVRDLEMGAVPLASAPARMAAIRATPRRMPGAQSVIGCGLLSAALAVLFRCPWWAAALALLVGLLVGGLTLLMMRVRAAAAVAPFVSSFLSTLLVGLVANALELGPVPLFAVCAPVAILVPGALITNALLELTSTDIVTGASRLMYGLIMLAFMAAGLYSGAALTGLRVDSASAALVGEAVHLANESGGWDALPPLWTAWPAVIVLAVGIGLAFGSGFRLTFVCIAAMTGTYAVLAFFSQQVGSVVATGIAAAVLFVAARVLERVMLAVPATVSFQPAFLLLVPGTVGLVSLASFDAQALASAPMMFLSLCIGTKVGALLADLARITRSTVFLRWTKPARMGEL
ncbi:threonine/serine exporter family protein [Microbacterium sp. nov. GSS16]|uniref:threonine/serine exporter family protein n=1 Tax=Microbacterium sp. nov. GSS16 TaxID=3019890 RepID=UPI002306893E|nr:threonine/serine exporter family protein [Microbacterium sp. nov. GSS16]WCD92324.1 threonine/serine exporter family protein [Microbacterium sp. nov. GSS16]